MITKHKVIYMVCVLAVDISPQIASTPVLFLLWLLFLLWCMYMDMQCGDMGWLRIPDWQLGHP